MKKSRIVLLTIAMIIMPIIVIVVVWHTLKYNIFDNPDFWYGYMSYFGTIILAAVALWQNHIFKEENDRSQEKLEKISTQANEISVILKIIEHEESRLHQLNVAFGKFIDRCDPVYILLEIKNKSESDETVALARMIKEGEFLYNNVFNLLSWDTDDDRELKYIIVTLSSLTTTVITDIVMNGYSELDQELLDKRSEARDCYDKYFIKYQTQLEGILFKRISLEEVYKIYKRDEEESNGQA